MLIMATVGALIFCTLFVWCRFEYTLDETTLRIQWNILGGIPFNSVFIPVSEIKEIRPFSWKQDWAGLYVFSKYPASKGFLLILKRRLSWRVPFRQFWLDPSSPVVAQLAANPGHAA